MLLCEVPPAGSTPGLWGVDSRELPEQSTSLGPKQPHLQCPHCIHGRSAGVATGRSRRGPQASRQQCAQWWVARVGSVTAERGDTADTDARCMGPAGPSSRGERERESSSSRGERHPPQRKLYLQVCQPFAPVGLARVNPGDGASVVGPKPKLGLVVPELEASAAAVAARGWVASSGFPCFWRLGVLSPNLARRGTPRRRSSCASSRR